ncbi:MAG: hypothetical protein AB7I24_15945 [Candidatus Nanopelagicales bacterium]
MADHLEAPHDWEQLYLARGDEVSDERPVFTGDVYQRAPDQSGSGPQAFQILQHPCALRLNGVDLVPRILAAEVEPASLIAREQWTTGFYKITPLPSLVQTGEQVEHRAARFTELLVVSPEELAGYTRVACLAEVGVNLLLQRWVHHNSRVVVPTYRFAQVTGGPIEEAELTEEWVRARVSQKMDRVEAVHECHDFLRGKPHADAPTRQQALEDPQRRADVRRAAKDIYRMPRAD